MGDPYTQPSNPIADLEAEITRLKRDQLERIATACMAAEISELHGWAAGGYKLPSDEDMAKTAIQRARALIEELNKGAKAGE